MKDDSRLGTLTSPRDTPAIFLILKLSILMDPSSIQHQEHLPQSVRLLSLGNSKSERPKGDKIRGRFPKGGFPRDELFSEFAANTRRTFRCSEVFRQDNLLGESFFSFPPRSEFWRLFRLNDPATQSRKARDMCTASCTLIG